MDKFFLFTHPTTNKQMNSFVVVSPRKPKDELRRICGKLLREAVCVLNDKIFKDFGSSLNVSTTGYRIEFEYENKKFFLRTDVRITRRTDADGMTRHIVHPSFHIGTDEKPDSITLTKKKGVFSGFDVKFTPDKTTDSFDYDMVKKGIYDTMDYIKNIEKENKKDYVKTVTNMSRIEGVISNIFDSYCEEKDLEGLSITNVMDILPSVIYSYSNYGKVLASYFESSLDQSLKHCIYAVTKDSVIEEMKELLKGIDVDSYPNFLRHDENHKNICGLIDKSGFNYFIYVSYYKDSGLVSKVFIRQNTSYTYNLYQYPNTMNIDTGLVFNFLDIDSPEFQSKLKILLDAKFSLERLRF